MQEIKAPNEIANFKYTIFLAGSIEMGMAEKWQDKVVQLLKDEDVIILNPRRDDWNNSWVQSIENPQFREQVEWELTGMECADIILMYFDPKTKSPITLLELGLFAKSKKLIVVCPDGFWKKGNVDIVCAKYGIEQAETIEEAIKKLKELNRQFYNESERPEKFCDDCRRLTGGNCFRHSSGYRLDKDKKINDTTYERNKTKNK
jgi:hypothetical protein